MGDFNKDALLDPQLTRVIAEWGCGVQPPRSAWTWRGAGSCAGQQSMIDFVLVPQGFPVRECRLVGCMPVRSDHRLVVVEIFLRGGGCPALLGVLPRLAQRATGKCKNINGDVLLGTMRHGPLRGILIRTSPSKTGGSGR